MIDILDIKTNVDLKDFCTFKIGGKCKQLIEVFDTNLLQDVCLYCIRHNIKHKVIGLGANIVFDSKGYNGLVIVNRADVIRRYKNSVFASSGVSMAGLLNYCFNFGLSGIEALAGIPSTVGGAVFNNLGANDCEFGNFIEYVECLSPDGKRIRLTKKQCQFAYRDSVFKHNNLLIVGVKIKLSQKSKLDIKTKIVESINKKITSQPLDMPSAGSVFKRCELIPAKIIDELGLKGTKVGGAMISTKHAGFIVNTGNANSNDVKKLIDIINKKVKSVYHTTLQIEIEFVN